MNVSQHQSAELEQIYSNRFDEHIAYRNQVWKVLAASFFSKLVAADACVLDLGCGYGEFINNIHCGKKYAMDLNHRAATTLAPNVHFIEQDCSQPWRLPDACLDVVFTSNFFEHLPSKTSLAETLDQARRCIKAGGLIVALGPNVRYVGGAYWDFWDHHLPLTNDALAEVLRLHGFRIESSIPRFLPYTMVNRRAVPMTLVSLYLKLPFLWRILGKQFLVVGRK